MKPKENTVLLSDYIESTYNVPKDSPIQVYGGWSRRLRKAGYTLVKISGRTYIDTMSSQVDLNFKPKKEEIINKPIKSTKPINISNQIRSMVDALNILAELVESQERELNDCRNQIARLSVAAKRAMVVYGGQ